MRSAESGLTGPQLDPDGEPWTPVRIETSEGKREYATAQATFAERGAVIRERLTDRCAELRGLLGLG